MLFRSGFGEATREALILGSRLAVRAALRRFSASSLATRSFSCCARAAACAKRISVDPFKERSWSYQQCSVHDRPVDLHADGRADTVLLVELRKRRNNFLRILLRADHGRGGKQFQILQEYAVCLQEIRHKLNHAALCACG